MKTTGTLTIKSKLNRKTGIAIVTVLVDGLKYEEFVVPRGDSVYLSSSVLLRNNVRITGIPVVTNQFTR